MPPTGPAERSNYRVVPQRSEERSRPAGKAGGIKALDRMARPRRTGGRRGFARKTLD